MVNATCSGWWVDIESVRGSHPLCSVEHWCGQGRRLGQIKGQGHFRPWDLTPCCQRAPPPHGYCWPHSFIPEWTWIRSLFILVGVSQRPGCDILCKDAGTLVDPAVMTLGMHSLIIKVRARRKSFEYEFLWYPVVLNVGLKRVKEAIKLFKNVRWPLL